MSLLRFALAQHDFPVGAVAANAARVRDLVREAKAAGATLVAFPELTLSGYPPDDLLLRPSFLAACHDQLQTLTEASADIDAIVGFPHLDDGKLYNAAAWLHDKRIEHITHKQVLPNYAVFDEKRYFQRGQQVEVMLLDGVRVALLVCEDIWDDAPMAQAAAAGAELVLVINASPWDGAKQAAREATLTRHARNSGCAIAYVNLVGGQDDLLFDGTSMLIQSDGEVIARAPSFVDALLLCEFDSNTRSLRAVHWPVAGDTDASAVLYAGLVRGIHDYVIKNGFPGVLLGLSGGIDSALTLALAVDALGADHVSAVMMPSRYTSQVSLDGARAQAEALGVEYHVLSIEAAFAAMLDTLQPAFAGKAADTSEENLQARIRGALLMALSNKHGRLLLTTGNKSEMAVGYATLYGDMCGAYAPLKDVYKTVVYGLARWRNSAGPGTRDPGLEKAGLGTRDSGLGKAAARLDDGSLRLPQPDAASPATVTCGLELPPESRVPSPESRASLAESRVPSPASRASLAESRVPSPAIPWAVINRPPSAELRDDQTDQDSLPPYAELDAILERFIEDEQAQAEIIAAGFDADTVHRIVRLVLVNEFKRRQAAPGPKVTRRAFGRERRYPITSGWR